MANSPVMVDDDRLGNEWLAHGKYPIAILSRQNIQMEFMKAGAPVEMVRTKEAAFLDGGQIATSLIDRAPHPNAARVFVNWYMSKEGSYLQSTVIGAQSARLDVPLGHIAPELRRDASVKYLSTRTEDFNLRMLKETLLAQEVFAPVLRK